MELLEGFLFTDIFLLIDYKLPTKLLLNLFHKLHDMGRDDYAKAPVKTPSILQSHCLMRITPIRFLLINLHNFLQLVILVGFNNLK